MDRRRGQGLILDPLSPLARAEYLAVGEAQGQAKGARITGAIALTEAEVLQHLRHRIERKPALRWVGDERRVEALLEQRLGAITFARGSDPSPDPKAIAAFSARASARMGWICCPWARPASRCCAGRAMRGSRRCPMKACWLIWRNGPRRIWCAVWTM
jgi:ATP-dependent helicase HrpB